MVVGHRMAKAPRTLWGQKTLGYKTRRRKSTNNMIVREAVTRPRGNKYESFIKERPVYRFQTCQESERHLANDDRTIIKPGPAQAPLAQMVGCTIAVHNGSMCRCLSQKTWWAIKLGEFSLTRKFRSHGGKKK